MVQRQDDKVFVDNVKRMAEFSRILSHEVHTPARLDGIEQLLCQRLDLLSHVLHHLRCKYLVHKAAETCVVRIVHIQHIATEWLEKCWCPRLLLTSVEFVFGKTPVLKSRESIVIAGDEPGCLAIREFHGE